MFTHQKRKKSNRKNVYGHRTKEFVHGYIDENQPTMALEALNSFTQPHYVPPVQDVQFVFHVISSPSEFTSVPPALPFQVLDRLLQTHDPLDFAISIPACSSAILTNTKAEFRDALPVYLGWDWDRSGMDKAIWKKMKRCRDEGVWELMYEEVVKQKSKSARTSPLTTPSSLAHDDDDEESCSAQRRLSSPGWRLLQWFVAVCEKDTALHAPRGVPYSPVFLRQIKKPYDATGQIQRSEADPIMNILRQAFEIDDQETETEFESLTEEDDDVKMSDKLLERKRTEKAKRARKRRERYREMVLSGLQKQELAMRLLSLLVATATHNFAIATDPPPPSADSTNPSRSSSPDSLAPHSGPPTPPTSSPSRSATPSTLQMPAKSPFHTATLSSLIIHLSTSLSPRARERLLQAWQGAEGVEWGPKSHLCAMWIEHWAGVGKAKANERRKRKGKKDMAAAGEWKDGWCGMSAPTTGYLFELLAMPSADKNLLTQQLLIQAKLALVSVLSENKEVYLDTEDRTAVSDQWQMVKGKVVKSLEIVAGKGTGDDLAKSLRRVGQFIICGVDSLLA
ncbi:hypothetical protein IAR50_007574 [Cryptococcus sp. DSM 104548]